MQLFVLRHGDAPYNQSDNQRSLSSLGVEETAAVVVKHLNELKNVEHIICSPVLRARQTLDVVMQCLEQAAKSPGLRISFEDCLKSESNLDVLYAFLNQCPEQTTLLVSHQPLVGRLVNSLADQEGLGSRMASSCMAAFDALAFCRGGATLQWLDHP